MTPYYSGFGSYLPAPNVETNALETARVNLGLILAGLTTFYANPSQLNYLNLANIANVPGLPPLPPKVTYTQDGENNQWTEYQTAVGTLIGQLRVQAQRSYGPFSISS